LLLATRAPGAITAAEGNVDARHAAVTISRETWALAGEFPEPFQYSSSMTRTTLPERNLDVLRAIAVSLVLANHIANGLIGRATPLAGWLGQAGVQAFFVHTSLVLMGSMEKDRAPNRDGWIKRFYVRRAWRIYPLAIVATLVVLLLHMPARAARGIGESFSLGDVLANLALVQDLVGRPYILGVLWTLPLELQMYIVLPFCYLIARKRALGGIAALMAAGAAMPVIYTRGLNTIPGIWRLQVLGFVPCFLSGVLAYWLLRRGKRPALPSQLWIAIIFADLALGFAAWTVWPEAFTIRASFCVVLGITIPLVIDLASSRLTRIAHTIATYSYGIYLLHPIALWIGFYVLRDASPIARVGGAAASLTLGCLAAYHGIEKPGIKLGRSIAHQSTPLEAEPAAP
jgi:peptidoglycan/LPS O-acetylase OafA/YrhL